MVLLGCEPQRVAGNVRCVIIARLDGICARIDMVAVDHPNDAIDGAADAVDPDFRLLALLERAQHIGRELLGPVVIVPA